MFFKNILKHGGLVKVTFPCIFPNNEIGTERLWCRKYGKGYKVDNIPFFSENIAYSDLIQIRKIGNELWFEDLLEASGNSVVQILIFGEYRESEIGNVLESLGCTWEEFRQGAIIAVNIPKDVNYTLVKNYLEKGLQKGIWDYKEACLGFK